MDWLDLLAAQGTLKSLLQHSSKASIPLCSAFFIVRFSYPYMTAVIPTALTRQTFIAKVMSLLFNMLYHLVIAFLPRSKHLLISWLQSPSAMILEPPQNSMSLFPLFLHLFATKWWDQMPWFSFSECWALSQLFHSSFTFIKKLFSSSSLSAIRVVVCISEVIEISPGNLDSSLCFFQPSVSHDILCI